MTRPRFVLVHACALSLMSVGLACAPSDGGDKGSDEEGGSGGAMGGSGGRATGGTGGRAMGGSGGAASGGTGGGQGTGGSGGAAASGGAGGSLGTGGSGGASSGATGGSGGAPSRDATTGNDGSGSSDAGAPDAGRAPDGGVSSAPAAFQTCAVCHGNEGLGTNRGPDIQHPVRDFATWVIRNGRMHPGFKDPMPKATPQDLPNAQLTQILDYLSAFPKPTTGAGLYKDFCANCHGTDAKGGVTMRPIATEPASVFISNVRGGHHAGEFSNRRSFMPKWTAAQISDAEIRMIHAHVQGL